VSPERGVVEESNRKEGEERELKIERL